MITQKLKYKLKGLYRVEICRPDKTTRWDSGWFTNILLTSGMNQMANYADWLTHCHVGTSGAAPLPGQSDLLGPFAATNDVTDTTSGNDGTVPYFGWKRRTYRFAAGTVTANLSEVGVGWGSGVDSLISRALIIDPDTQLQTTVTPLADEFLKVSYELRYYPPLVDVNGPQVTLNGEVFDTITRAAEVTSVGSWASIIGTNMGIIGAPSPWIAWSGDIGAITALPSGTGYSGSSDPVNAAYSNNSFERQINMQCGPDNWNVAGGIRSISIKTSAGAYQTRFGKIGGGDETIPKSGSYIMQMAWTISWSELPSDWEAGIYALGDRVTHNDVQWESDISNNTSEPGVANWTLA